MGEVDEDFEKDFAELMSDFKLAPAASYAPASASAAAASGSNPSSGGQTVSFKVMMKRGGRDDRSKAVQASPAHALLDVRSRSTDRPLQRAAFAGSNKCLQSRMAPQSMLAPVMASINSLQE